MNVARLRVGLVGPLPPPSGGMANQTMQLATLLRSEGAAVEVIRMNRPYRPRWIGKLPVIRAMFRLPQYLVSLWQAADHVDVFHVMANSGWSWHLFSAPVIWIARLRRRPVVINYRGGEADAFLAKSLFWVKPSLDRTHAIIVPSGFLRTVFQKYGIAAEVVPNIINLTRFSSDIEKSSSEDAAPSVLVARNLEPIYDNATALRAFNIAKKRCPALRLIVAGSGPERHALEKMTADLGLTDAVTFTGRVDNEHMPTLYRKAKVVLNPSLVDNMPNSLLEAMASGIPVVSTNVGGVPYVVEHGITALLVPPQDADAMAEAILALINNPERARAISEAGTHSVQQYTWTKVRGRLLAIYERVLAKESNPMGSPK